jgi:hypothetical protein
MDATLPTAQVHSRESASNARVISVSARDIEQRCEDRIAAAIARLEALIVSALDAINNVDESRGQLRDSERKATKAAIHLQERLRLGARMMQAFQSQFSHAEDLLAQMRDLERRVQRETQDALVRFGEELKRMANERLGQNAGDLQGEVSSRESQLPRGAHSFAFRDWAERA